MFAICGKRIGVFGQHISRVFLATGTHSLMPNERWEMCLMNRKWLQSKRVKSACRGSLYGQNEVYRHCEGILGFDREAWQVWNDLMFFFEENTIYFFDREWFVEIKIYNIIVFFNVICHLLIIATSYMN